MNLLDLFNLRRFNRCRRVFATPWRAHVKTASGSRETASLPLVSGGTVLVPKMRNARRLFRWLLCESKNPLPITTDGKVLVFAHNDRRIALRPVDTDFYTFEEVVLHDGYGLSQLTKPLDTVIDIGTNIGLFTSSVAPLAQRVISVEPVDENLKIARKNIELGSLDDKVVFHNLAIAGQPGSLQLFLSDHNYGGHSISEDHAARWGGSRQVEVQAITLEQLFEQEKIAQCSLLKCDVEGAEFEIFDAAPVELLARIDRIFMEIHLTRPEWNEAAFEQLASKLRTAGHILQHESLHDDQGTRKAVVVLTTSR